MQVEAGRSAALAAYLTSQLEERPCIAEAIAPYALHHPRVIRFASDCALTFKLLAQSVMLAFTPQTSAACFDLLLRLTALGMPFQLVEDEASVFLNYTRSESTQQSLTLLAIALVHTPSLIDSPLRQNMLEVAGRHNTSNFALAVYEAVPWTMFRYTHTHSLRLHPLASATSLLNSPETPLFAQSNTQGALAQTLSGEQQHVEAARPVASIADGLAASASHRSEDAPSESENESLQIALSWEKHLRRVQSNRHTELIEQLRDRDALAEEARALVRTFASRKS